MGLTGFDWVWQGCTRLYWRFFLILIRLSVDLIWFYLVLKWVVHWTVFDLIATDILWKRIELKPILSDLESGLIFKGKNWSAFFFASCPIEKSNDFTAFKKKKERSQYGNDFSSSPNSRDWLVHDAGSAYHFSIFVSSSRFPTKTNGRNGARNDASNGVRNGAGACCFELRSVRVATALERPTGRQPPITADEFFFHPNFFFTLAFAFSQDFPTIAVFFFGIYWVLLAIIVSYWLLLAITGYEEASLGLTRFLLDWAWFLPIITGLASKCSVWLWLLPPHKIFQR